MGAETANEPKAAKSGPVLSRGARVSVDRPSSSGRFPSGTQERGGNPEVAGEWQSISEKKTAWLGSNRGSCGLCL